MENLLLTVNIVLPIFLVMVVGFCARRGGLINDDHVKAMNRLVFRIFLPVSLAKSLMTVDSQAPMNLSAMLFCMAGVFATFLAALALVPRFEKDNARRGVLIQGSFRSNYAIFGIPLAEALFPAGDGGLSAMMVMATIPLFNVLAVTTFEMFRGGRCSAGKVVKGIAKNPLIWGCAIGYALMRLPVEVPAFAMSTVSKLASVASPLALFVLGASIDPKKLGGNAKALVWGVSVRLVLAPAVLLSLALLAGFRGAAFATLMIAFASPCAVSSHTMAAQMGGDDELAAQLVMLTTVLSSATIFLMIFLFKTLGIF